MNPDWRGFFEAPPGDSLHSPVTEAQLSQLKGLIGEVSPDASDVLTTRNVNDNTRYCRWGGQSTDGRKHQEDLGYAAAPFEGASDNRIRLSDTIVNEHVLEVKNAATRSIPEVSPTEGTDAHAAAKVRMLLKWHIRNQWGRQWPIELERAANFCHGDSPAGAVFFIDWQREESLEIRSITPETLIETLIQLFQQRGIELTPEHVNDLLDLFIDETRKSELVDVVAGLFPKVRRARVLKMVRDLYRDGVAEFPMPYLRIDEPFVEALKVYDDIFFPRNTVDLQRARMIVRRKWYSYAEVLDKEETEGWSREFVDQLTGRPYIDPNDPGAVAAGHQGKSAFENHWYERQNVTEALDEHDTYEEHAGLYEVLYMYSRGMSSDGVPAIYLYTISSFCNVAANDRQLFDRKHGKYPVVDVWREHVRRQLMQCRGAVELSQSEQDSLKLHTDSFEDHVQKTTNPPLLRPKGLARYQVPIEPHGQIDLNSPRDRMEYLNGPEYPSANDAARNDVYRRVAWYFGRPDADVPEDIVFLHRQGRVDNFLGAVCDVLTMVIQLDQQYMSDEKLQRITGGAGLPVARSSEEIQGKFDVDVTFDVRDGNMDYVLKKGKLFMDYVAKFDRNAQAPYEGMMRQLVSAIDPNLAEQIPPAEQSLENEVADERRRIVMCLNGVRPFYPEGGMDYNVRLKVFDEEIGTRLTNPGAFEPLSPAAATCLQEERKYLEFQTQQIQNAETGKKGFEETDLATVGMEAGATA